MDAVLTREAIEDALGAHPAGALPTVDELTELIAQVEINAFLEQFDISDDLLLAAWYLHGVASGAEAAELYQPQRQARAFAVSARIFDLALNDPERAPLERLALCFAAQVGFRRSGLDPNATAVYRRLNGLPYTTGDPVEDLDGMALSAGVAFLSLDFERLSPLLRTRGRQLSTLAASVELETLAGTMYGPAQAVITAVSALLVYLQEGQVEQLEAAQVLLSTVLDGSAGIGDHYAKWVAAHLRTIAEGLGTSSVWAVLPPGTPRAVAQAFTYGPAPVLTLWPPQQELLTRGERNPLDPTTSRLLLSVPTSAGKTLLAQLIICAHLATSDGDVCFVTPLRSLGREVRQSLGKRLRMLRRNLGLSLPDHVAARWNLLDELVGDDEDDRAANVEVVTPERLTQMLRADPEDVLSRFTLFVIDEAQLLAQRGRGFVLEGLLAVLAQTDARLVLLSGVLGNATAIASWLGEDTHAGAGDGTTPAAAAAEPAREHPALFTSAWRGPRQLHVLLYTQKIAGQQTTETTRAGTTLVRTPMSGLLLARPIGGRVVSLTTSEDEPVGELIQQGAANGKRDSRSTPAYVMVAKTASHLLAAGSLLMVVSQRNLTKRAAQELAAARPVSSKTGDLVAFLRDRLGSVHPLIECVQHGVGFHHAGLPNDVLEALEDAVRSEQLDAIVATTTLTEGVNLPVRTVVISETRYEGQDPEAQLSPAHLLNAMGRAGRAGKETEGWIVLALSKTPDVRDFGQLTPSDTDLEARSSLLTQSALDTLVEAETLVAQTVDSVLRLPPGEASDFAGYVWFVLSTWEQLGALTVDAGLPRAVERLLAFEQMPEDLRARWVALGEQVKAVFLGTDPVQRRRWATTGTSLPSAARIEGLSQQVADHLLAEGTLPDDPFAVPRTLTLEESVDLLDRLGVFDALLALPEAQVNGRSAWRFTRGRTVVSVPMMDGLRQWLAGARLEAIANAVVPASVSATERLEQTVDAVNRCFEHFLSWTVGVLVEQVNQLLVDGNAAALLPRELGPMVHYGVDTPVAVGMMAAGVHSRTLAHAVGHYADDRDLTVDMIREELGQLHIEGWRQEFNATPHDILELLEFVRAPRSSLLRDILESGTAATAVALTGAGSAAAGVHGPAAGVASGRAAADGAAADGAVADSAAMGSAVVDAATAGGSDVEGGTRVRLEFDRSAQSGVSAVSVVADGTVVGYVAAAAQADVLDILNAGIAVSVALDGDQLTLTRRDPV